ncbi:glycosyltransferase family 25 protein [Hypoxylon sp. FL1857]|nr:glycosyltransferase family 25 protein [Hypoxylon sp. FL1857]
MSAILSVRRLPSSTLFAISAFLLLSLYLLSTRRESVPYFDTRRARPPPPDITDDIFNSTLGFEKIFVVGLPSRTDRRDGMVLQAALSNIEVEFIDGVLGKDVPDKALPSTQELKRLEDAVVGAWRGHMNAIQEVVRRNLSSALIMEDDADWDVRIRQQLHDYALAARALTQPLAGSSNSTPVYADVTYPRAENGPSTVPDIEFDNLPATVTPKISPYGDDWDLFWAGHCGMHFPFSYGPALPKGRVVHRNDSTAPQKRHLWTISSPYDLKDQYPDHTRVVHHVQDACCSLAYAVTQAGARRILREVGLKDMNEPFDLQLKSFCEGSGKPVRGPHNCLTVQPPLFNLHFSAGPKAAASDISDHGEGYQHEWTSMTRYSVRLNADALLDGRTDQLVDQLPDAE